MLARLTGWRLVDAGAPGDTTCQALQRTSALLYAELAQALALRPHAGGWSAVLAEERLRADALHANAAGYERRTQALPKTLRETGLFAG